MLFLDTLILMVAFVAFKILVPDWPIPTIQIKIGGSDWLIKALRVVGLKRIACCDWSIRPTHILNEFPQLSESNRILDRSTRDVV